MFHESIELKLWPRPKKIAFIVNAATINNDQLLELFLFCQRVWGGRQHVIIPSHRQSIGDDWWKLLQVSDADEIYSFCKLKPLVYERLCKEIQPFAMWEEKAPAARSESKFGDLSRRFGGIRIEEIAPFFREMFDSSNSLIQLGSETVFESDARAFATLNFGALPSDLFPKLTGSAFSGTIFSTEADLLEKLNSWSDRGSSFPIDLCSKGFPYSVSTSSTASFEHGFHLVVGDSAYDLLYAWNRATIENLYQIRDTLWIPTRPLRDENMLQAIGDWFAGSFFCTEDRPPRIVSHSIGTSELIAAARNLRRVTGFTFLPTQLEKHQFPMSPPRADGPHSGEQPTVLRINTRSVNVLGETVKTPIPSVADMSTNGGYVVDAVVKSPSNGASSFFYQEDWKPPRRVGVAELFIWPPRNPCRITASGCIAYQVSTRYRNISITVPTEEKLFSVVLQNRSLYNTGDIGLRRTNELFTRMMTSQNGSLLREAIRIFGSITGAADILGDAYWLVIFSRLLGKDLQEQMIAVLKRSDIRAKLLQNDLEDVSAKLKEKILRHKAQSQIIGMEGLRQEWGRAKANKKTKGTNSNQKKDQFESELDALLKKRIFFQGSAVKCDRCGVTDWWVINALETSLECAGCLSLIEVGHLEITFRLNSLLYNALSIQGNLQVLETMDLIRRSNDQYSIFLPSQDIFEDGRSDSFTDLDIAAIINGKFWIGEVKSSSIGLQMIEIKKCLTLVNALRPDVFIISAPVGSFDKEAEKVLSKLETGIKKLGVEVKRFELNWGSAQRKP